MEIREFVSKVLGDLVAAVDEASSGSSRTIILAGTSETRTVEFDIAVSVEENKTTSGRAGIKVLQFVEAGGDLDLEHRSSTVSRIRFGVTVDFHTKAEKEKMDADAEKFEAKMYDQDYS
jgi:hypothetical protein